jgi:hypothetical protein
MVYARRPLVSRLKLRRWGISRILVAPQFMPYPEPSSLAISVACHPMEEEGDITNEGVQWGIVKQESGVTLGRLAFTKMPLLNVRAEDKPSALMLLPPET